MFFLGASAHILIYLLVPAFLIVCLCFNGRATLPEGSDLLPVCITYEPRATDITADTYIYCVEEQQEKEKSESVFCQFRPPHLFQGDKKTYYAAAFISLSLRAPPVSILG